MRFKFKSLLAFAYSHLIIANAGRGQTHKMMTRRVKAYFRLIKWRWAKNNQNTGPFYAECEGDDDILDFDLQPYLGWMEEELKGKSV